MKTSKFFESPLWKSAFFVYGLVAMGFSVMSFLMSSETKVPSVDELRTFTGVISQIEEWWVKNNSGYNLILETNEGNRKFNISRCEYLLNLGRDSKQLISPGDVVTVLVEDAHSFAIVDGSAWQLKKNGVLICSYEKVVENQIRSDQFGIKLAIFLLIFGLLLSTIGIIRTRRAGCPSKA
uniref:Uncharacterized protein n=1 Tax=Candidatus Kentrum sp. LFY TaxID=2126342 RepID=A0A450V5L2_9GAMM|nr:MAG: hypothetical protein BECKLFY1418B_GA0070995_11673 [Candidatus Kentron sp. LFY]